MAIFDYPYNITLPANPVNASCKLGFETYQPPGANDINNNTIDIINRLINATSLFYNPSNLSNFCVGWTKPSSTLPNAWEVLSCNQIVMPNSTGDNTMFPKYVFNKTAYTA